MAMPGNTEPKCHSLKLICEALDEHGPMTAREISQEIGHTYEWVRRQAIEGVKLGYMIETRQIKNSGGGRPSNVYSRTAIDVSEIRFSSEDPAGARNRQLFDYRPTKVEVRRDPFIAAFFGEYRAQA